MYIFHETLWNRPKSSTGLISIILLWIPSFVLTTIFYTQVVIPIQAEGRANDARRTPLVATTCPDKGILYVNKNANGANNGIAWPDAYIDMQSALTTARSCADVNQIWVASGVYTPGLVRTDTFTIPSGVTIYGGFVGGETNLVERDWKTNSTILSGDIDNNDITSSGVVTTALNIVGNNSYHVVTFDGTTSPITTTTSIDGFVITAGKATGSQPNDRGAGIYCDGSGENSECSPLLVNLIFIGNGSSSVGGAMYNNGLGGISSPTLTDVIFDGNITSSSDGGAMYNNGNYGVSSPTLTDVIFDGNIANSYGGAMYNNGLHGISSPTLTDVIFDGNIANSYGGAMYNLGSSPTLTNVSFYDNSASSGGAMYNNSYIGVSSPTLTNVSFYDNSAKISGGAMYNWGHNNSSSPTLTNVIFDGNIASHGGAMYNLGSSGESSPTLTNVSFYGNSAKFRGGAMYNSNSSSPTLTNVIFDGNIASDGGAMYNLGSSGGVSSPTLTNVIFDGNIAEQDGGAMYNYATNIFSESSPTLTNVSFYDNSAKNTGRAIYNRGNSGGRIRLTLKNSVLWGNKAINGSQIYNESDTNITIHYSLIEDGDTGIGGNSDTNAFSTGTGNINANPLFADAASGDLRLLPNSPAIDSGNNSGAPSTDIQGLSRPINTVVDMGAHESQGFNLTISGGNTQTTTVSSGFATRLQVTVTSPMGEPIGPGGSVIFIPPSIGPGLDINNPFTATTDIYGLAMASVTANAVTGSYTVTATARGVITPVVFLLTNIPRLSVIRDGNGVGKIASAPEAIDCGITCTTGFENDVVVNLTATPDIGSIFDGWSGACTGIGICTVTMTETKSVTATFSLNRYMIEVIADPSTGGTVSGGGAVSHFDTITVTATPNIGYTFVNWREGDTEVSTDPKYSFMATTTRTLTATFSLNHHMIHLPLITKQ